ncbi:unnamed protein product [Thelazia callipaeda]|uniref:peroxidase n=1 Tax=Thelazia callipaeda TaxID=103827 RepID=A0A0N5D209_THECL|nr:unnamed protein product [Thelazia callipaeda]
MIINLWIAFVVQTVIVLVCTDETSHEKVIDDVVSKIFDDARQAIDELQQHDQLLLQKDINPLEDIEGPLRLWSLHSGSDSDASKLAYAALISILATKKLKNAEINSTNSSLHLMKILEEYCPLRPILCNTEKYRSIDGTCNNVLHPLWGAKDTAMQRIINPFYSDEIEKMRVSSVDGSVLPNLRYLSKILMDKIYPFTSKITMLTAHWAHFVYNDLVRIGSLQLFYDGKRIPLPCCSSKFSHHSECMPITVSKKDSLYSDNLECIPYTRTAPAPQPNCDLGFREQVNQMTSFLDGQLLTDSDSLSGNFPLIVESVDDILKMTAQYIANSGHHSFINRFKHLRLLASLFLQDIWMRQHNHIAISLMKMNPHWSDEQLYQESRRIVIAQLQHVTYNEFLPILLGKENWIKFTLQPQSSGFSKLYNLRVNPSVINTYAAAAGQFFFTMLGSFPQWHTEKGKGILEEPLNEYFKNPDSLLSSDQIASLLMHLLRDAIKRPLISEQSKLYDKLFIRKDINEYDLAAVILQIGRDHGIPPYNVWREYCTGSKVESFSDLVDDLVEGVELVKDLENEYKSVHDVDLFLLGLAEKPINGALLGPTFSCILSLQFQKIKIGDRYWYENDLAHSAFTEEQLAEIRKTTVARIICNTVKDFSNLQPRVFELADDYDNYPINCNETSRWDLNISKWRDDSPKLKLPITVEVVEKTIEFAVKEVEKRRERERRNILKNQHIFKSGDPLLSYGKMMRAKREAITIARVSEVLLEATKMLMSRAQSNEISELPGSLDMNILQDVLPHIDVSSFVGKIEPLLGSGGSVMKCLPKNLPCDHTTPYRTMSGWCNNLRNPSFANAFGALIHLLPPAYEDGIDKPRAKSVTGELLPSARTISNLVHFDLPILHQKYSHMIMQFGQILDHELTHSPVERGPDDEILNCTRCDSQATLSIHCMPLPVPAGDPHFPTHDENGERRCLPFARSLLGQLNLGYRNQINQLTPYLDGSVIYGSTDCEAKELRAFSGGRLNSTNLGVFNSEALPQGDQEQDCRSSPQFPCFVAGDERNSHQPGLTSMHNIFLREHNRIARKLEELNPSWDDERIYQETRRIVAAEFAHITYNEYLPLLLGDRLMQKYNLNTAKTDYFHGYDETCDASISHPFATAAFRFGHTLVSRVFSRLNPSYQNFTEPVDLVNNFNYVGAIYDGKRGSIDSLLVGLLGTPAMAFDRHVTTALRNHLFGRRGEPLSGMDLVSLNILRARDHGVQPYNAFRELCGMQTAKDFDDLFGEMSESAVEALKSVYKSVDDIDLFPGLLCEKSMPGALLAPTMACIIAEQFKRIKKCDRFYYENDQQATRFSREQLNEIRKVTLSSLLCANSHMLESVQPNAFLLPDKLV